MEEFYFTETQDYKPVGEITVYLKTERKHQKKIPTIWPGF